MKTATPHTAPRPVSDDARLLPAAALDASTESYTSLRAQTLADLAATRTGHLREVSRHLKQLDQVQEAFKEAVLDAFSALVFTLPEYSLNRADADFEKRVVGSLFPGEHWVGTGAAARARESAKDFDKTFRELKNKCGSLAAHVHDSQSRFGLEMDQHAAGIFPRAADEFARVKISDPKAIVRFLMELPAILDSVRTTIADYRENLEALSRNGSAVHRERRLEAAARKTVEGLEAFALEAQKRAGVVTNIDRLLIGVAAAAADRSVPEDVAGRFVARLRDFGEGKIERALGRLERAGVLQADAVRTLREGGLGRRKGGAPLSEPPRGETAPDSRSLLEQYVSSTKAKELAPKVDCSTVRSTIAALTEAAGTGALAAAIVRNNSALFVLQRTDPARFSEFTSLLSRNRSDLFPADGSVPSNIQRISSFEGLTAVIAQRDQQRREAVVKEALRGDGFDPDVTLAILQRGFRFDGKLHRGSVRMDPQYLIQNVQRGESRRFSLLAIHADYRRLEACGAVLTDAGTSLNPHLAQVSLDSVREALKLTYESAKGQANA